MTDNDLILLDTHNWKVLEKGDIVSKYANEQYVFEKIDDKKCEYFIGHKFNAATSEIDSNEIELYAKSLDCAIIHKYELENFLSHNCTYKVMYI